MTNQQIGRSLGVSEHTIKSAIGRVLARLGLKHRTGAVVYAVGNGWIDTSPCGLRAGHEKAAAGVSDGRFVRGDFA